MSSRSSEFHKIISHASRRLSWTKPQTRHWKLQRPSKEMIQLTYTLFRNILRMNVIWRVRRPPVDHICFYSAFRSRPFQCYIVWINNWHNIGNGIRSDCLVNLLRVWTFYAVACRVDLNGVFFARCHIGDIGLGGINRRQTDPLLVTLGTITNGVFGENGILGRRPANQHRIAGNLLDYHVSWRIWICKVSICDIIDLNQWWMWKYLQTAWKYSCGSLRRPLLKAKTFTI